MFFDDEYDPYFDPDELQIIHREMFAIRSNRDVTPFEMRNIPTHTEDGIPIRKLYVSNLPPNTTRSELFGLFAQYGFIKSCWLRMEDRGPNRTPTSTYAFVTFSHPNDAHKALVAPVHEKTLRGKRLRISPADSWHQPAVDADGKVRWKPNSQHQEDQTRNDNSERNAENVPESTSEPESQPNSVNDDDSEQCYNILDILNRDCLTHILTYVPIRDLIRSERVSKGWQSMVQEYLEGLRLFKTSSWQNTPIPLTTAVLRHVLQRIGAGLLRLHIDHHWSALNDRTAHTVGKFCKNLDEVKVVGMLTKNWNPLLYGCKQLKSLSFISCNKLTDSSLVHLLKHDSCLESLTIANNTHVTGLFLTSSTPNKISSLSFYNCYSLQGTVLCAAIDTLPNLTSLKLDVCPTTMWKIVPLILTKLPQLQELSLSEYTSVETCLLPLGDEAICKAISNLAKLKTLNLSRNIYITNSILKQVAQSCPLIESLNISNCNARKSFKYTGISDEGVIAVCSGCSLLRRLDVSYLVGLTDAGVAAAARLRHLNVLVSHGNPALTAGPFAAIIASCSQLEEVDLCGCNGVSEEVIVKAVEALDKIPRPLLLRLAGTLVATQPLDLSQGTEIDYPTHKLLTVDVFEDRSNPHLRHDFVDGMLEDSSDGSYDDLYDDVNDDDNFDGFFGPDDELFLDEDFEDYEPFEINLQMPNFILL